MITIRTIVSTLDNNIPINCFYPNFGLIYGIYLEIHDSIPVNPWVLHNILHVNAIIVIIQNNKS